MTGGTGLAPSRRPQRAAMVQSGASATGSEPAHPTQQCSCSWRRTEAVAPNMPCQFSGGFSGADVSLIRMLCRLDCDLESGGQHGDADADVDVNADADADAGVN